MRPFIDNIQEQINIFRKEGEAAIYKDEKMYRSHSFVPQIVELQDKFPKPPYVNSIILHVQRGDGQFVGSIDLNNFDLRNALSVAGLLVVIGKLKGDCGSYDHQRMSW